MTKREEKAQLLQEQAGGKKEARTFPFVRMKKPSKTPGKETGTGD